MLRAALHKLSEKEGLRNWLLERRFARAVAYRFVAGASLDEAMRVCRALNGRGMRVSLDHLGESVTSREEVEAAVNAYLAAIERIAEADAQASVSLKLTQLGLAIDETLCATSLARVVHRAHQRGIFVRIDMEQSTYVEATLRLHRHLFVRYRNVGVVIQSALRRSEADVRALCALEAPVRLVKGAYQEPADVAFQSKREVDESFVRLFEMLAESACPLAVATHDTAMIERAKSLARALVPAAAGRGGGGADETANHEFANPPFEFQLLYGVRRDLQEKLRKEGYEVRVYVPYGTQWYAYLLRRLAERPANLAFIARSVAREFLRR